MSWVKKKFSKKNKNQKIKRQKVVKFMKRKSPCTCQSYSHSSRSAKQISESFSTNGHQNKKLCTLENWRLNCFFSKKSTFVTETSFQLKEWYLESLQQRFCTQNKKKSRKLYLRKAIKFTYCPRLNLKGWAWRWFLRKLLASLKLL